MGEWYLGDEKPGLARAFEVCVCVCVYIYVCIYIYIYIQKGDTHTFFSDHLQ